MVANVLRALWAEPRPGKPPARVWRDWVLVGTLLMWSVLETVLRDDPAWLSVVSIVSVVIALTLLWRRTHPLSAVAIAFGTLIAFDVARIFVIDATGLLSIAGVLVLPYSLFRWGAGREAGIGVGIILAWLVITHVADPTDLGEVVAGYGFFLFSAALGAAIRFTPKSVSVTSRRRSFDSATSSRASSTTPSAITCRPSPSRPRPGVLWQHPTLIVRWTH